MKLQALGAALSLCSFLTLASAQDLNGVAATTGEEQSPKGIAAITPDASISYHGGPVLGTAAEGPVKIYLIFYGKWSSSDPGGPALMEDFFKSLGGSKYWNIFTSYTKPARIQNAINLAGTHTDTGSQGSALSDAGLKAVVTKAITSGALPAESNAIYHVVTSREVTETGGFCSQYCGFHTVATISGTNIKYSFVGNPAHCPGGVGTCNGEASNNNKSPNNDPGVDAMISILAHETGEAVTDPDLNAWHSATAEEGDVCAYHYGTTFGVSNGSKANVKLGGRNYLVQESLVVSGSQHCALSF